MNKNIYECGTGANILQDLKKNIEEKNKKDVNTFVVVGSYGVLILISSTITKVINEFRMTIAITF